MSLGDQLFRSFNIMATLAAAERIMKWYPGIQLSLDLGDRRGKEPEIESLGSQYIVVAEAFNAVSTEKNAALLKCWERLLNLQGAHRYIFFHAPNERDGHREDLELMVEQKRRKRLEDQLDHESRIARTGQTGLQRAQAIERWVELVHALTPDRETISSQISWQRWDATLKDFSLGNAQIVNGLQTMNDMIPDKATPPISPLRFGHSPRRTFCKASGGPGPRPSGFSASAGMTVERLHQP